MTSAFTYRGGVLHAEQVSLAGMAATVGTPFYCYAAGALAGAYQAFADAFGGQDVGLYYALKANSNLAVIRSLARRGAGADVVSEGELRRALAAGIPPEKIVFSGVGKSAAEMAAALNAGIFQINVESIPELEALSAVASGLGVEAAVALRVNPDVDAGTHHKISTGRKENKFGIDFDHARAVYAQAAALPGVRAVGVAVHIGSQLTSLAPFRAAFKKAAHLVEALRAEGHAIARLDLGGGLGIVYREEAPPAVADYAAMIREVTQELGCHVMLEPGRAVVGNAGVLVSRVLFVKNGLHRRFVILDAAMNDLIRPALYEAWHGIVPVAEAAPDARTEPFDVVGPVCETGDTFATQRPLVPPKPGDLMAILSAGAYGAAMSSSYNTRPLIPEVLVDGQLSAVIRPRPSYDEILGQDRIPEWLR